jgi:hypothetical protein
MGRVEAALCTTECHRRREIAMDEGERARLELESRKIVE